jgi:hypothetical protein
MAKRLLHPWIFLLSMTVALAALSVNLAAKQAKTSASEPDRVNVGANEIGGTVRGPAGPEPGVWVIAESSDLPTKFRKIVVTDDRGRFLVPDLPKSQYKVWVRGYGLADSVPDEATLGANLPLTVTPASDARVAAQMYPANYWFSLLHFPAKTEFPMTKPGFDPNAHFRQSESNSSDPEPLILGGPQSQNEGIYALKLCFNCHELGDKATREIEPNLGRFDSTVAAWDRRLKSGQRGPIMGMTLNQFPRDRALSMLADWSDRIAAGEVPPSPPRPEGVERNVVISEWDWGKGGPDWIHDAMASDERDPKVNAKGIVYGASEGLGTLVSVDPNTNVMEEMKVPTRVDPKTLAPYRMSNDVGFPSPYFGETPVWTDNTSLHNPMMDERGRVWMTSAIRLKPNPAFCKEGSSNPYAINFPIHESARQASVYDPETKKFALIDTCFGTHHLQFARDKEDTLYFSGQVGALGWVDTKVFDKTGDEQAAQGWCPAYYDTKGTGQYDAKVDKTVEGFPYGLAVNPVDGSVWYTALGLPGKLVRVDRGSNPPATCRTEVYEPPYENPKAPGKAGFFGRGLSVDTSGVLWVALAGSGHLASFDRRKCATRAGTGQQCPEGWTLYQMPGPEMNGASGFSADYPYFDWVDQFDALGLGKNTPIATGTNSDSLVVLNTTTHKWIVMRVPYPLGLYTRGMNGRIDDPKGGWKDRGVWTSNATIPVWHEERGMEAKSMLVRFQIRPNPLAH